MAPHSTQSRSGSGRYYGWKPSPPDHRDVLYAAPRRLLLSLPPKVDLNSPPPGQPFNPVFNQESLGSCGPNSAAGCIDFEQLKQKVKHWARPSRLFIYWFTRFIMGSVDQDSGVDNRSMMKALAQFGWCNEAKWSYKIQTFTQKPNQDCIKQAAGRKIARYENVPQDLTTMKACIAGGDPFIYGFTVYQSFESPQTAQTGIVPMPQVNEGVLGGHDIVFVGYDDSRQYFKFRNSWGAGWGDGGYGYMPYAYATSPRLSGDFWKIIDSGMKAAA